MSITTPNDLFTLALKDAGVTGVGQTPSAEDINDAMSRCNMMLAQWQRKRWLVYCLVDTSLTSTGAQSYTVGVGGDFNIMRPDRLEAAFFRQVNISPNPPDYPLEIIESREDYNRLTLKNLTSFPQYIFYDSAFPLGRVYPWPIPQSGLYEIHIATKAVLAQFTSLAQNIDLPEEYKAAIFYNLMQRLRIGHRPPPDPDIINLAKDALNTIQGANVQIPRLRMPDTLVTRGAYDIYSDTSG